MSLPLVRRHDISNQPGPREVEELWDHDAVQKPGTREDHLNHRP
jgi:hypothetical protein